MRILLISQDFYPLKGGIATYLMQIYKNYFANDNFKVVIPKGIVQNKKLKSKFEIERLNFSPFVSPTNRKEKNKNFLEVLKRFSPDIVLFGYIRSHPEIMYEYKKINSCVKWGIVLHAKEVFFDKTLIKKTNIRGSHKGYACEEVKEYKQLLNSADFLICVSNFTKKLIKKQKIRNKNIFVVYPMLRNLPSVSILNKRREFTLLSVGRLVKRKGHEMVLSVLKDLRNEIPEIKYKIVGNGPEENRLKSLIDKYELHKLVKFEKDVNDNGLRKFYSECDIFVLPTKFIKPNDIEGFGIVFIEASSFAKPVIGGKSGGVIESVDDGKSGFLVNSEKELYDKILLLYKNKNLSEKIGKYGRKRVVQYFYRKKNEKFVKFLRYMKRSNC